MSKNKASPSDSLPLKSAAEHVDVALALRDVGERGEQREGDARERERRRAARHRAPRLVVTAPS